MTSVVFLLIDHLSIAIYHIERTSMSTVAADLSHYPFRMLIDVRFGDIDSMGHVNNAMYLTYFETARVSYYMQLRGYTDITKIDVIIAEITARYHYPALFGDQLEIGVRVSRMGTKSFDLEYLIIRPSDQQRIASGHSVQVMYDYATQQTIPIPENLRVLMSSQ